MKSRFKNISMRTSTQTQLSQVEKEYARLEKDPQRVEHEWAEICDAKEVIDSAKDMVLANIKNHTMEVLINHYKVLMRNSQRLPVMHLVYCCEVYCKEAFDMSYDIWARALVPLLPLEVDFDVEHPAYGQTQAMRLSADSADFKKYAEVWQASCLVNNFWKAIGDMSSEEVREDFKAMAIALLEQMATVDFTDCPNPTPFQAIIKLYKGLLALVSPVPGVGTLDDVNYVYPSNATTASIISDIPKLGRSILSILRKDKGSFWSVALKDFQLTVGVQLQNLPAMKKFEQTVFSMTLPDELSDAAVKAFSDLASMYPLDLFVEHFGIRRVPADLLYVFVYV